MKKKINLETTILVLGIIFILLTIKNQNFIDEQENRENRVEIQNETKLKSPKNSRSFWNNFSFIHIKGNWSTAAGYDWCSGDGTLENPYIIENITIDASSSPMGIGIFIENSKNDYFIINNCTVYNAGSNKAGIRLESTNNGTLLNNNCSYNDLSTGIELSFSWNNIILGNIIKNNTRGIDLVQSRHNIISGNSINNNTNVGVHLDSASYYNNFSDNAVNYNNYGFYLEMMSDSNNIIGNDIYGNDVGINIYGDCTYNTISRNIIKNNSIFGIQIDDSDFNTIYLNKFIDNAVNAFEVFSGDFNGWNNPEIGNYWDDYGGVDSNKDGIGDSIYSIPGPGPGVDLLPIWDFIEPNITINAPYLGQSFGKYSPVFEIEIEELSVEESWYTIDNGVTNISFSGQRGIIDSSSWYEAPNGHITIRFYVRDFMNNIGFKDVIVIKDSPDNLIDVDIIDQTFTETEFTIEFTILSENGLIIDNPTILMWWNATEVPPIRITYHGGALYSVVLTPITIVPGGTPILLNMTIYASGYEDKYYELNIAVEKEPEAEEEVDEIGVEIIEQLYSENWFNLTFYVYNASNPSQGIEWAMITGWPMWWNGSSIPIDEITTQGGGFYSISLIPITVAPTEDPILLNMTISASGYQDKYYELDIAVDPELIDKYQPSGPSSSTNGGNGNGKTPSGDLVIPLITLGISIAAGCVAIIIAWKKQLFAKLKRK